MKVSASPVPVPCFPETPIGSIELIVDTNRLERLGHVHTSLEQGVLRIAIEQDQLGEKLYKLDVARSAGLSDRQLDELHERIVRTIVLSILG